MAAGALPPPVVPVAVEHYRVGRKKECRDMNKLIVTLMVAGALAVPAMASAQGGGHGFDPVGNGSGNS